MRFRVSLTATAVFLVLHPGFGQSGPNNGPQRPSFLDRAWRPDPRPPVYRPPTTASEQVLRQLDDVQARTFSILRKAEDSGDLPTALEAAWQLRANTELIYALRTQTRASTEFQSSSPIMVLAFKDGSIRAVRAYWIEGGSLHFITMEGAKETISADQLDRQLTLELAPSRTAGGS